MVYASETLALPPPSSAACVARASETLALPSPPSAAPITDAREKLALPIAVPAASMVYASETLAVPIASTRSTMSDTVGAHRGWTSRGYLPHWDHPGVIQAVTFRLADCMPASLRAEWRRLLALPTGAQRVERMQAWLDAGHGSCALRDPRIATLAEDALLYFDGERYRLLAWVIMPNHVHVLVVLIEGHPLASIVHTWKPYTAHKANAILEHSGRLWYREYYDRYIRDEDHLEREVRYIHSNPVIAGLVEQADAWPYGSARRVETLESTMATPGERYW